MYSTENLQMYVIVEPHHTALLFSWCDTTLHFKMCDVVVVSVWCAWSLHEGWHLWAIICYSVGLIVPDNLYRCRTHTRLMALCLGLPR